MWLRPQALTGIFRLVARPANNNHLFSTCNASQQWKRPDQEMKYYTDPVWRRHLLDTSLANHHHRCQNDLEERERLKARSKAWRLQNKATESQKRTHRLTMWCYKHSWVHQKLPWKNYAPELYGKKVEHHCTGCGHIQLHGHKLWWHRTNRSADREQSDTGLGGSSATEQYLCSACFFKNDWQNIAPRGFEDTTTFKEVKARARELGIDVDGELEQDKHVSEQNSPQTDTAPEPKT